MNEYYLLERGEGKKSSGKEQMAFSPLILAQANSSLYLPVCADRADAAENTRTPTYTPAWIKG